MLLIDGHLDLSLNAVLWGRDLTRSVAQIRQSETSMRDLPFRGQGTVSLPEMRRGHVGLCIATMIGRCASKETGLMAQITHDSPEEAWEATQQQLAWYRAMESNGQMIAIQDAAGLERHLTLWQNHPPDDAPIGYVLSLEGADSIVSPQHLQRSVDQGLRVIGLGHNGPGRYAGGTDDPNGLTEIGRELLAEMQRLGVILDAAHLSSRSFDEAMGLFAGPVWASHGNCRALVPGDRQFSDEQLLTLIQHDAVIGTVFDSWMLTPHFRRGTSSPADACVTLDCVADHIDHICQLAGNARHVALGSDLDGGYGREQCPADVDTIADLQQIPNRLAERGMTDADIRAVMHGNWIRILRNAWSESIGS